MSLPSAFAAGNTTVAEVTAERGASKTVVYQSADEFATKALTELRESSCLIVRLDLPLRCQGDAAEQLTIVLNNAVPVSAEPRSGETPVIMVPQRPSTARDSCVNLQRAEEILQSVSRRFLGDNSVEHMLSSLEHLSQRELDVLLGLLNGKSCKQLASELAIGFQTIAKHKCRLFHKLNVKTLAELTTLIWSLALTTSRPGTV